MAMTTPRHDVGIAQTTYKEDVRAPKVSSSAHQSNIPLISGTFTKHFGKTYSSRCFSVIPSSAFIWRLRVLLHRLQAARMQL